MIKPTIGRVVWYWGPSATQTQPFAALVVFVHSDIDVNLVVFDDNGTSKSKHNVFLYQGEGSQVATPIRPYAEWMPYQKGQAAKTEELEKNISKQV